MKIRSLLTVAVALSGPGLAAALAPTQPAVPVISREVLFGNPTRLSPRLSPDGTQLSFLAPVDGVLTVWVGPADAPERARPVIRDQHHGIRIYQWAYTSDHILFLRDEDEGGSGSWRLYCVNLVSGNEIALSPATSTTTGMSHNLTARIQHVSHKYPEDIVIGLNDRDPNYHDLYVANIDTGELIELQRNEGMLAFYTDDDYSVRMASRLLPDGGNELLVMSVAGNWDDRRRYCGIRKADGCDREI